MRDHPRLLCIMGSGETAPTMRAVHADLLRRIASVEGPAVMLDTPYGFQENAEELNVRTADYFSRNVGHTIELAAWRGPDDSVIAIERALARVRSARYVFAGPGSPSYALREWRGTGMADALRHVMRTGGCVTFASAAAVTLGAVSLPVYEIYKAGIAPHWETGLGVLDVTGLRAAVIPHFDNREGGTHDTRYCYLGERRLRELEPDLPDDTFILGVDEHTACIVDLGHRTVEVRGRGVVTVRANGQTTTFPAQQAYVLDDFTAAVEEGSRTSGPTLGMQTAASRAARTASKVQPDVRTETTIEPLVEIAVQLDARQRQAIAERDISSAVSLTLELEQTLQDWSADTLVGTHVDEARALLRGMIVRLGEVAAAGARDPRKQAAPYVEAVLEARRRARESRAYELADLLRDALTRAGVEVRDTPTGDEWLLRSAHGSAPTGQLS